MSAESDLAGLYEPVGDDMWNEQIKWQPIPIHTIPEKTDSVRCSIIQFRYYNNILYSLTDTRSQGALSRLRLLLLPADCLV